MWIMMQLGASLAPPFLPKSFRGDLLADDNDQDRPELI